MKNKRVILLYGILFLLVKIHAQPVKAQWGQGLYATSGKTLNRVNFKTHMCSDGSFYTTFMFSDEIHINNYIYYAYGGMDMIIARYTRQKSLQWVYQIHQYNGKYFYLESSFRGENNSLYLGLDYDSAIAIGSDTTLIAKPKGTDKRNALVLKMNYNGTLAWVQNIQTGFLKMSRGGKEGCFANNIGGNFAFHDTDLTHYVIHFNGKGEMDYKIYSPSDEPEFFTYDNKEIFIRGSIRYPGYKILGNDTVRPATTGVMGYLIKYDRILNKIIWTFKYYNKGPDALPSSENLTAIDKSGNIYFVDVFWGDSVTINNKRYDFPGPGYKNGLFQLDKNGNLLQFISDSLNASGETQYFHVGLSADSTKLLFDITSSDSFWLNGTGNFTGPAHELCILDIPQNLKCTSHYALNYLATYSFNAWDFTSYGYCYWNTSGTQYDTIKLANTGGSDVGIIYFSNRSLAGVKGPEKPSEIRISPNPAHGEFTVQAGSEIRSITLMDVSGREVLNTSGNGYKEVTLSRAGISNGVYLVKITTAEGSLVQRVVLN